MGGCWSSINNLVWTCSSEGTILGAIPWSLDFICQERKESEDCKLQNIPLVFRFCVWKKEKKKTVLYMIKILWAARIIQKATETVGEFKKRRKRNKTCNCKEI